MCLTEYNEASVVCGLHFSYKMDKNHRVQAVIDPENYYENFWEILEGILNSALFVMIGFVVLGTAISSYAAVIIPVALLAKQILKCGLFYSNRSVSFIP